MKPIMFLKKWYLQDWSFSQRYCWRYRYYWKWGSVLGGKVAYVLKDRNALVFRVRYSKKNMLTVFPWRWRR